MSPTPDVTALSDASLWCRRIGHKWEWVRDEPDKGTFDSLFECERCGLPKTQTISLRTFELIRTRPGPYPDHYLVRGGRLSATTVRAEQYRRAKTTTRRLRLARA